MESFDASIVNTADALKAFKCKAEQLENEFQQCTLEIKELRKRQTKIKHKFSLVSRVAKLIESGKIPEAKKVISAYNRRASFYR